MLVDMRRLCRTSEEDIIENYERIRSLVRANIEYAKLVPSDCAKSLYAAVTQLATIEELDISVSAYDYLLYVKPTDSLDASIADVENLLSKLDIVIMCKVLSRG